MNQEIERYLALCETTRRPKTVENRRNAFRSFARCLESKNLKVRSLAHLRRRHIEAWLLHLVARRPAYSHSTRYHYVATLLTIFRQMADEWGERYSPLAGILTASDLPEKPQRLPKPLTPNADASLRQHLMASDEIHLRALLLLRHTGLRLGELLSLSRDCLTLPSQDTPTIRVPLGKLHNERFLPVDPLSVSIIERFQREHRDHPSWLDPRFGKAVHLLLCRPDGRPLNSEAIRSHLKQAAQTCGIQDRVHPHRLRHTYATELLRCGMSALGVMHLLGHRRIDMTLHYLEVTQEDLCREFAKARMKANEPYDVELFTRGAYPLDTQSVEELALERVLDAPIRTLKRLLHDGGDPAREVALRRVLDRLRKASAALSELNA